jgi:hypothetical protein
VYTVYAARCRIQVKWRSLVHTQCRLHFTMPSSFHSAFSQKRMDTFKARVYYYCSVPRKDTDLESSAGLLPAYILATALTPSLQVISESFSFSISLHTTSEEIESNVLSWCPPVRCLHLKDQGAAEEDRNKSTQEAKRGTGIREKGASISRLGSLASLADCGSKETLQRKRMTACQPPIQSLLSHQSTKPWGQSQWAGPKYRSGHQKEND